MSTPREHHVEVGCNRSPQKHSRFGMPTLASLTLIQNVVSYLNKISRASNINPNPCLPFMPNTQTQCPDQNTCVLINTLCVMIKTCVSWSKQCASWSNEVRPDQHMCWDWLSYWFEDWIVDWFCRCATINFRLICWIDFGARERPPQDQSCRLKNLEFRLILGSNQSIDYQIDYNQSSMLRVCGHAQS